MNIFDAVNAILVKCIAVTSKLAFKLAAMNLAIHYKRIKVSFSGWQCYSLLYVLIHHSNKLTLIITSIYEPKLLNLILLYLASAIFSLYPKENHRSASRLISKVINHILS